MGINVTLRGGSGDMPRSVYDPNLDGVIAKAQTEAKCTNDISDAMGKSVYDSDADGIIKGAVLDIKKIYKIGDATLHAHDAEVHSVATSYTKVKTITLDTLLKTPFTLRTHLELHSTSGGQVYAKIYKNGGAVGTERNTVDAAYQSYNEDLLFAEGDTLELWVRTVGGAGYDVYVQNFRVLGSAPVMTIDEALKAGIAGVDTALVATNT